MKKVIAALTLLFCVCCCINTPKDITLQECEELTDQSQKDGCYQEQGIVTGEIAYCEKVVGSDFRDRCFFRIAIDLSKPALCGRIEKGNDNSHCLAITLRDDSFCAKVDRVDRKDKCYYDLGSTGHVSSCGLINGSFFRDNCYVTYGYNKGDLAICEKIENAEKRKSCYYGISDKGGWSDPVTCDMIPEEYRDECFVRMIASAARPPV
jgi:hypothetical protein